jgi:DNA-binding response OmpR family regulator
MAAKTVDVHVCKLRQRLKRHKIAIETIWGIVRAVYGAQ